MAHVGGVKYAFRLFLLLYSAFFAFRGAISLKIRYMVLWEKPDPQKVLYQIISVVEDFRI